MEYNRNGGKDFRESELELEIIVRRRCPGQGEESCGESRNNKRFCNYCVQRWLLEDKVGEGLSAAKVYLRRRVICGEGLFA